MRNPQCWGHPGLKCMLSLPQNRMFVHFKAAQNPLANDNWLLMQVYPLGSVLYWKKCVQFLDCLSWLVQIQRLPPGISLERECNGRAYGSSNLTGGCRFSRAPGSYSTFLTGFVWQQFSQGDYLATPSL